jgi:prepilin-type N-terminal cleavage/methylation domain-containing protein
MNIILKQRLAEREHCDGEFLFSFPGKAVTHHRNGFTLVEVIVVLVILAILAAIAIPALTGYIDKAEDKKYIADARNAEVALRAVFDEAYADGTLGATSNGALYIKEGVTSSGALIKRFAPFTISKYDYETQYPKDNLYIYFQKANDMMGIGKVKRGVPGEWSFYFVAPKDPTYTMINAPAFMYYFYPEGTRGSVAAPKPQIIVTYGIDGASASMKTNVEFNTAMDNGTIKCDPNVGYRVYHVDRLTW